MLQHTGTPIRNRLEYAQWWTCREHEARRPFVRPKDLEATNVQTYHHSRSVARRNKGELENVDIPHHMLSVESWRRNIPTILRTEKEKEQS